MRKFIAITTALRIVLSLVCVYGAYAPASRHARHQARAIAAADEFAR